MLSVFLWAGLQGKIFKTWDIERHLSLLEKIQTKQRAASMSDDKGGYQEHQQSLRALHSAGCSRSFVLTRSDEETRLLGKFVRTVDRRTQHMLKHTSVKGPGTLQKRAEMTGAAQFLKVSAVRAPKFLEHYIFVIEHESLLLRPKQLRRMATKQHFINRAYVRIKSMCAKNQQLRQQLKKRLGRLRRRMRALNNGLDLGRNINSIVSTIETSEMPCLVPVQCPEEANLVTSQYLSPVVRGGLIR